MIYENFLGIDPGQNGGLALIKGINLRWATKMPETEADLITLVRINPTLCQSETICMLEKAQAFPGQGVASSFKYGSHYGSLRAILLACGVRFEEVRPAIWQKAVGALTHGDKNRSKLIAQQLFPDVKVTHAIADALLIAEYGRRKYGR